MAEQKPRYFKFHRVFSTKKHLNGTVLQHRWSEEAKAFSYNVVLDSGEKIWATGWTLTNENPIKWFIGSKAYHIESQQDCEVVDIRGFNSSHMDWILQIQLANGDKVYVLQRTISRQRILKG